MSIRKLFWGLFGWSHQPNKPPLIAVLRIGFYFFYNKCCFPMHHMVQKWLKSLLILLSEKSSPI
jgi:hypothetical protein